MGILRRNGVWGLPPRKIVEVPLSKMSEYSLLQNRICLIFIIDLYAEMESLTPQFGFIEV